MSPGPVNEMSFSETQLPMSFFTGRGIKEMKVTLAAITAKNIFLVIFFSHISLFVVLQAPVSYFFDLAPIHSFHIHQHTARGKQRSKIFLIQFFVFFVIHRYDDTIIILS